MFPMAPQLKFPSHASFLGEGSLFRLLCWGIKISCSQWKAQACTNGALLFFLLNFGRRGEGGEGGFLFSFIWFPMCSPTCSMLKHLSSRMLSQNYFPEPNRHAAAAWQRDPNGGMDEMSVTEERLQLKRGKEV